MVENYGEFSALSRESIPFVIPGDMRINFRIMEETLKDRIKQRLDDLGMSAREASLKAGMAPDTLGKVLNGKTRKTLRTSY